MTKLPPTVEKIAKHRENRETEKVLAAMIRVEAVEKRYGTFQALQPLDLHGRPGEVFGFLGPNGAGKSTTMKIITGFMPPTSGTVEVAGFDIVEHSLDARKHIGYLPETVPLYADMTVSDYLSFMGTIRGMSSTIVVSENIIEASFKALIDSLDYKLYKEKAPAND